MTLGAIYTLISANVSTLPPADLRRPSRCTGWTVGDVLYHQLLDARRALVTFASPAQGAPDVDEITYWRSFQPGGEGYEAHATHVRRVASAYSDGALGREWRDTSAAAVRAAQACPHERVTTQGHILTTRAFISTLIFEATIHYLDMTVDLPDAPPADLTETRKVLDGLLGTTLPWDDETYALKATGRVPLTEEDRSGLGELATRFPLTG
jgi:uncharacterized protein (TIGR03083 family)